MNTDQMLVICGVMGLSGGLVAWILAAKDREQQKDLDAIKNSMEDKDEAIKLDISQRDKILSIEISRMVDSTKACWVTIDRLKEERNLYWTRDEHSEWKKETRDEIKSGFTDLTSRFMAEMKNVENRFSHEVVRLHKRVDEIERIK